MASQISVINSEYCVPDSVNLKINMEMGTTYIDNHLVFGVKKPSISLHGRRVVHDVSGNPTFTLYKKNMTAHGRCHVFRGDSTDKNELLFSVKRPKMISLEKSIDLGVFLANNINESVCDFKVKANRSKTSCDIYEGESSRILARMEKKGAYELVMVHPNIDYAFIVALLIIVDEIKRFYEVKGLSTVGTFVGELVTGFVATAAASAMMPDD